VNILTIGYGLAKGIVMQLAADLAEIKPIFLSDCWATPTFERRMIGWDI
jgi:hypothetical protein